MNTIGERIRVRREELNISQDELAKKLGYKSRSSINKIESDSRNLTQSRIKAIADALGVTPAYIMGWEDRDEPIPCANLYPLPNFVKKPRLGTIACGKPILAVEDADEYDDVPEGIDCDFTLLCKGDSMINARIFDGDIVYIRKQDMVDSGDIAAVLIEDEATLKRVRIYDDHIILAPENPTYRPLTFWGEEMSQLRILGKAVAFTSKVH